MSFGEQAGGGIDWDIGASAEPGGEVDWDIDLGAGGEETTGGQEIAWDVGAVSGQDAAIIEAAEGEVGAGANIDWGIDVGASGSMLEEGTPAGGWQSFVQSPGFDCFCR